MCLQSKGKGDTTGGSCQAVGSDSDGLERETIDPSRHNNSNAELVGAGTVNDHPGNTERIEIFPSTVSLLDISENDRKILIM